MQSLEAPLLKKRFAKVSLTDYPDQEVYANLPPDVEGDYQPVIIGHIDNSGSSNMELFLNAAPAIMVDLGTDQGGGVWRARKFKICADLKNPETGTTHGLNSNLSVYRYNTTTNIVTLLTAATNYNLSDNNTQIDFVNAAAGDLNASDQIRVADCKYIDDGAGTFTGTAGAVIRFIPDVIHFLLVCFASIPTGQLDLASLGIVGATKGGVSGTYVNPPWQSGGLAVLRGYFNDQIEVGKLIDILAFPGDCILQRNNDGKLTLKRYSDLTHATDPTLIDVDITNWQDKFSSDSIRNRIMVNYFHIPGGAQSLEFDVTRKKRKKKRTKIKLETEAFRVARNNLTRVINGVSVRDDLGEALGIETETVINTYFQASGPAQDFANELYRRWGRGFWQASFTEVGGGLLNTKVADRFIVYRKRSSHGDISSGKAYRLIDANSNEGNQSTTVNRADEIKN